MTTKKQLKPWYKKWWAITLFVIIGLGVLGSVAPDEQSRSNTQAPVEQTQPKAPSYKIKIVGNTYADPANRRLTFTVKNTGNRESNPACNVSLSNETGTYQGTDYVTWDTPLAPGDTKYFEGLIVITNEGAAYATKSNVSCVERAY